MVIKTIVNGAHGKMGQVTVACIQQAPEFELVASTDHADHLGEIIQTSQADVVIDFTTPAAVFTNAKTILEHCARPVIGTSGLTGTQINTLSELAQKKKIGALIAPNFALGAIMMMKLAKDAAPHFSHAEIIEMHHEKKVDAPSGTAIKTADMMQHSQPDSKTTAADSSHARGYPYKGISIHAVRLPGLFAHQTVIFGSPGETLSIRHDCMDRQAMMPGVLLACRKVMELDHLVYGLEHLI